MRVLLILAALAALAGCATPAPTPVAGSGSGGVVGAATIARWGTWEMDLAPAYTRLALARHNAAVALTRGRITVDTAVQVQAIADQARALLDRSRRGDAATQTDAQRADLAAAIVHLDRLDQLLTGARP